MGQQHENVRQAIDQVNAQFMQAFNRGDAASATAAAYREDATILPPGAPRISGREAITQFWQGAMAMGVRQVVLQTQELQVSGDHAYEIGVATLTLQPAGGPARGAPERPTS